MPKITSVEPQKSSKGRSAYGRKTPRFNIFLDGQFAFGADEDLVVNHRLIKGKVIPQEDLPKLIFESEVGKIMDRVYGLFSVRSRSEKETRDYLKNLSFKRKLKDQDEISLIAMDLIIERLKQKGWINDLEFAKAWVESRRRSKQKSAKVLKMELFAKGIDREIIEEILRLVDTRSGQVSEEDLAKLALEKKLRIWKNLPKEEFKKKAYGFLMRKGFEYSLVKDVVEKVFQKE